MTIGKLSADKMTVDRLIDKMTTDEMTVGKMPFCLMCLSGM